MPELSRMVANRHLNKAASQLAVTAASVHYHRHPNDSCHSFSPHDMLTPSYRILFGTLILFTALVTLVLNLFVIITVVYNQNRQSLRNRNRAKQQGEQSFSYSKTHQSFISLSISVIIYSSICVPGLYLKTIDNKSSSGFFVYILLFSFYVSPIASSFMHLLMAFDRYLAIRECFNFRVYWYRRNYTTCIWLLWAFSILIMFPFIWYQSYSEDVKITLTLIRLLVSFSIPSLMTLVLYLSIAYELAKMQKSKDFMLIKNVPVFTRHKKLIVKIIILGVVHFLCWFPFSMVESLNDLFPDLFHRCSTDLHSINYYYLLSILILITSMSGIAYPILYCFVSEQFRKMFWINLKTICRKQTNEQIDEMDEYYYSDDDGPSTVTQSLSQSSGSRLNSVKSGTTNASRHHSQQSTSPSVSQSHRRKSIEINQTSALL